MKRSTQAEPRVAPRGVPIATLPVHRDGHFILFDVATGDSGYDIFFVPLEGDHKPRAFVRTHGDDLHARFSPDGRWVAYSSDESGGRQVYVPPFPTGDGRWDQRFVFGAWARRSALCDPRRELRESVPDELRRDARRPAIPH
jgi:hypothetical protein